MALERGLAAELTDHLNYERGESSPSARPNTRKRECDQDRRPRRWGPSRPVAPTVSGEFDSLGPEFCAGGLQTDDQSPWSSRPVSSAPGLEAPADLADRRGCGTVSLRSVATGLVVSGRSVLTEGTGLTMDEWASKPWQTWRIRPTSTKRGFAIVSADDSFRSEPLAVDVTDNAGLGSFVQVQRWRDVPSQHFLLLRVREP